MAESYISNFNAVAAIIASTITGTLAFLAARYVKQVEHIGNAQSEDIKAKAALFDNYQKFVKELRDRITELETGRNRDRIEIEELQHSHWECQARCNSLQTQVYFLRERLGLPETPGLTEPTDQDLRQPRFKLPNLDEDDKPKDD